MRSKDFWDTAVPVYASLRYQIIVQVTPCDLNDEIAVAAALSFPRRAGALLSMARRDDAVHAVANKAVTIPYSFRYNHCMGRILRWLARRKLLDSLTLTI